MVHFSKMHGLGNDYIYIDKRFSNFVIAEDKIAPFVRYASNRHFGIGADGVVFIESSNVADFKMRIFNQDGSEAEMCGNGIRCFAKLVYENKFTNKTRISIETLAGIKHTYLTVKNGEVQEVVVDMGKPILESEKIPVKLGKNDLKTYPLQEIKLEVADQNFNAFCLSMGNPHCVIIVDNVDNFDIQKYGSLIEAHPAFPNKTNVEFIQILDKGHIKMRVWERGSGETFACGTGACAVAVACNLKGFTRSSVKIYLRGGELKIDWNKTNGKVYLSGIATKVFSGEINIPYI